MRSRSKRTKDIGTQNRDGQRRRKRRKRRKKARRTDEREEGPNRIERATIRRRKGRIEPTKRKYIRYRGEQQQSRDRPRDSSRSQHESFQHAEDSIVTSGRTSIRGREREKKYALLVNAYRLVAPRPERTSVVPTFPNFHLHSDARDSVSACRIVFRTERYLGMYASMAGKKIPVRHM